MFTFSAWCAVAAIDPTPRKALQCERLKASSVKRRSVRIGTLALTLHLFASSLIAVAQPTGKVHRIGLLRHFACPDEFGFKDLRQRLGELGYIEGRASRSGWILRIAATCRPLPRWKPRLTG